MWEPLARERVALKKIREKYRGTDFPGVSIIISTNKLKYRDNIFSNFKRLQYNFISKIDDDDYYGDNYLTDLINVFKYTDAEVIGKLSAFPKFLASPSPPFIKVNYNQPIKHNDNYIKKLLREIEMKNGRIKHINELNLRLRDEIDALSNL